MKKWIFIIPVSMGLLFACTGGRQNNEAQKLMDEKTDAIEQSTLELEEAIQSSELEMEEVQSELDTLLNDL
ncbi:MAG: hypothetical protein K0B15_11050 [Lentimicrobium sp.]|nr:hypothetical protein [Lentimicrobium sp.]